KKFDVLIFVDDGVTNPVPQLKKFLQDGGTVLSIGRSTGLAYRLELPINDALTNASGTKLTRREFYVPGSILEAKVDNTYPLAYGMPDRAYFFYDDSPAFHIKADGLQNGLRSVAWYDSPAPLRSGWAWGQKVLENAAAVVEASVGKGKLFLFGPEI